MSNATLDGKSIGLDEAYQYAAKLLGAARFPVVAGLGADAAGARAAILLAERLRGAFDHLASVDAFKDIDVTRSSGMFLTTPGEARVRADVVLLVGPNLSAHWPALFDRLALDRPARFNAQAPRKVVWVGPGPSDAAPAGVDAKMIAATAHQIPFVLAAWRARLGGRPVALDADKLALIDALVASFAAAHFGVAVWSAATLDALTIEMLQGLVTDLNVTTRFTGVPIGARSGATGVTQVSGWMTGFPPRTGFGRGYPEHDPWRFDARRLVESGEADAAVWISAYDGEPPPWSDGKTPDDHARARRRLGEARPAYRRRSSGREPRQRGIRAGNQFFRAAQGDRALVPAERRSGDRGDHRQIFGGRAVLTCLRGGHVVDPVNGVDAVGDVYFEDGRIVAPPEGRTPDVEHDVSGHIVMAGAIDIHSHIAGGGVNTARLLLPEAHRAHRPRPANTPLSTAGWSTFETGRLYAQMGYTTVIEPAVSPHHALHAHLELADIPIIDKGFLTVLGNEDLRPLGLPRRGEPGPVVDYIGATLEATRAIGVKCVNAGGVDAFKQNVRSFLARRCGAGIRPLVARDLPDAAAGGERHQHSATRCICT